MPAPRRSLPVLQSWLCWRGRRSRRCVLHGAAPTPTSTAALPPCSSCGRCGLHLMQVMLCVRWHGWHSGMLWHSCSKAGVVAAVAALLAPHRAQPPKAPASAAAGRQCAPRRRQCTGGGDVCPHVRAPAAPAAAAARAAQRAEQQPAPAARPGSPAGRPCKWRASMLAGEPLLAGCPCAWAHGLIRLPACLAHAKVWEHARRLAAGRS